MVPQVIAAHVDDDKMLSFTATSFGDITGDTHQFVIVDDSGKLVLSLVTGGGVSINVAGGPATYAVIQVDLTNRLEIAAADYRWQLRRTNAGREDTLAYGTLPLTESYRDAT